VLLSLDSCCGEQVSLGSVNIAALAPYSGAFVIVAHSVTSVGSALVHGSGTTRVDSKSLSLIVCDAFIGSRKCVSGAGMAPAVATTSQHPRASNAHSHASTSSITRGDFPSPLSWANTQCPCAVSLFDTSNRYTVDGHIERFVVTVASSLAAGPAGDRQARSIVAPRPQVSVTVALTEPSVSVLWYDVEETAEGFLPVWGAAVASYLSSRPIRSRVSNAGTAAYPRPRAFPSGWLRVVASCQRLAAVVLFKPELVVRYGFGDLHLVSSSTESPKRSVTKVLLLGQTVTVWKLKAEDPSGQLLTSRASSWRRRSTAARFAPGAFPEVPAPPVVLTLPASITGGVGSANGTGGSAPASVPPSPAVPMHRSSSATSTGVEARPALVHPKHRLSKVLKLPLADLAVSASVDDTAAEDFRSRRVSQLGGRRVQPQARAAEAAGGGVGGGPTMHRSSSVVDDAKAEEGPKDLADADVVRQWRVVLRIGAVSAKVGPQMFARLFAIHGVSARVATVADGVVSA
jgi:hypothetical protein